MGEEHLREVPGALVRPLQEHEARLGQADGRIQGISYIPGC